MSESKEGMTAVKTAVTAEQIIAEVRRLAAERPDFVYVSPEFSDQCLYMHGENEPGCIFGHALFNLGVDTSDTYGPIGEVLTMQGIAATVRQRDWMRDVQYRQDHRLTWGQAIRDADEARPNV